MTTNWGCNWCLNENICLFNTSKCEKTGPSGNKQDNTLVQLINGGGKATTAVQPPITTNNQRLNTLTAAAASNQQRSGNTINQVNQCPTFDVGHKQDILIADGSEKELTIKVKNMPQFKVSKVLLILLQTITIRINHNCMIEGRVH